MEQDKADMGKKLKRANKDAKRAQKDARKAKKAASKACSKSDKIQAKAVLTRRKIRQAENMTADAEKQVGDADQAQVRAMKWTACVEREGLKATSRARGVLERSQLVGQTTGYCDHRM